MHQHQAEVIEQIVHDLRSPLWTIALETGLLGERLASGEHPEIRTAVSRITRNVDFLDRLIQDLLDSAAMASGHFELQRRPTELRALLVQIVDRAVATNDRARVIVDAPHPLTLSIDVLRIERVAENLLHNAIKYAPKGSTITLRLEALAGGARISVTDGGPGLTAEETTFVFDKYRRAASAQMHQGTGLGLYVSKQLIEAHGGTIGVDSVHGSGSRFFFELPAE